MTSDDKTGFSVAEFFASLDTEGLDTNQVLSAISNRIKDPLKREVRTFRRGNPDEYEKLMRDGPVFLTIYVTRVSANRVEGSSKAFKLSDDEIVPEPTISVDSTDPRIHVLMTKRPEVDKYIGTHPDIWNDTPEKFIDRLMNVVTATHPDTVGPPFTIVIVTKDGPKWLRQDSCAPTNP